MSKSKKLKKAGFNSQFRRDKEILDWAISTGRTTGGASADRSNMNASDYKDAFYKEQMNNPHNLRAMETFNLAKNDEEFKKSLGGKMSKFIDSYETSKKSKGKEKDGNIVGIDSYRELETLRDFQEKYHKHKMNNGGDFSSANDKGGNYFDMGDTMRAFHDRNFLTKDDQIEAPVDDQQTPDSLLPDDYTPSPQLQRAQNLVRKYEDGILQSQSGEVPSAFLGEIATNQGVADDSAQASDATSRAQSFLDKHTLNLKEGFKKYGINTRGENSTASRNDELMQGLG